jgi:hypothetical protein
MEADIVELTVWLHEHNGLDDEFSKSLKAEIVVRGGPSDPDLVREWLGRRAALRDGEPKTPDASADTAAGQSQPWSRVAPCLCGGETKQLLHGYTERGALWKGHVCACSGWQCSECGRILDRAAPLLSLTVARGISGKASSAWAPMDATT